MTSDDRKTANQQNTRRRSGPRSLKGKMASARNARKHGLAIRIFDDPDWTTDVDKLARILIGPNTDRDFQEQMRILAGTMMDLMRAQAARTAEWNAAIHGLAATTSALLGNPRAAASDREAAISILILPRLVALDRYERRAQSRWKRVVAAIGPNRS